MSGRDEEFREFMRDRASLLHQNAYLLCGDWHLAHDLVQDTLVKAYQHWFVSIIHAAGPIQGSTAGATSSVMTPAEIKGWLDSGKLKIVGRKDINGHQAIGLRQPWADGYRELWVDSRTFLPVREIMADFASAKGPLKNVMPVAHDTWLPRTKSLLDMVNHVRIPAGFTQVAPPQ